MDAPHFKFPFEFDGQKFAEVEQDTFDDVAGCVQVVLRTPLGFRDALPEFGTPNPTFKAPPSVEAQRRAVAEWEPRAQATVTEDRSALDEGIERVRMETGGK